MTSALNIQIAHAVADERIAAAGKRRRATVARARTGAATARPDAIIALRVAAPDERPAVERLAALDGVPPLAGDALLALVDGEPVAALSLADGRVAADPFRHSADAVELLQMRAERLAAPAARPRRQRRRRLLARAAG